MKLYLSSAGLGKDAHRLPELTGGGRRAALILNAQDANPDPLAMPRFVDEMTGHLSKVGFIVNHVDLREYFGRPHNLSECLAGINLVWATGGNAFLLRRAMRQSGCDAIIKSRISETNFVYAGHSAGACVAAPTLKGIHLVDDPQILSAGYDADIIWDGLSLVPYCIAPHYRSNHPESDAIEGTITYFIKNNMPYVAIREGDSIISEINQPIEQT